MFRREPTFGAAASQPFSPSQAFQSETTEQSVQSNALGSQEFVENVQVENVAEEKSDFLKTHQQKRLWKK